MKALNWNGWRGVFAVLIVAALGMAALGATEYRKTVVYLRTHELTADSVAVGGGGAIDSLLTASATAANASTSTAVTVTGALPGDIALAGWTSGNTSGVAIKGAAVTTNTVTVTHANPGTTSTLNVVVLGQ